MLINCLNSRVSGICSAVYIILAVMVFSALPARSDSLKNTNLERGDDTILGFNLNSLGISSCSNAFGKTLSEGSLCLQDQAFNRILDAAFDAANQNAQNLLGGQDGKQLGKHFMIKSRLNYSSLGSHPGLNGDLDAVIPLGFTTMQTKNADTGYKSAFFSQQGITRWKDSEGFRRNDTRIGVVYRFNFSEVPGNNIFGIATFRQENIERGHQRIVSRYDYAGKWGESWLNNYKPATDWLPGRLGYEERALAGMELGHRLHLTNTIDFNIAAERWEAKDGSSGFKRTQRAGIDWHPHAWLRFGSDWQNGEENNDEWSVSAALELPLGLAKGKSLPSWQGLGVIGAGTAPDAERIWQPVDNISKIKYAEREVPVADPINGAAIRFLQQNVNSGNGLDVEVTLAAPATKNLTVTVVLVPEGDNPAIAGEDYVDQPIELVIPQGSRTGTASIQLLNNPNITQTRSLQAAIEAIS